MADLLLELFSEEIPARMQAQAAKDLERLVVGALTDRGLLFEGAKAFYGPRRLTLVLAGLPVKQPDVSEEIKGPKVDAPAGAIAGFLKKTGLTREQLQVQDTGKGKVYIAVIDRKGRATADVLAEVLPECFAKLPWPKSMRWPQEIISSPMTDSTGKVMTNSAGRTMEGSNAPVRWVRPLHSILCTLDGEIVPFHFAGVGSSDRTRGHRFLSSGPIVARRYDDYVKKLREAHVVLDAEERKAIIFEGIKSAAFVRGLELIEDEGLVDEVAGLAEWPVVLIGAIEDQFMDIPPEILQTSMRVHQKYFALRDPKTGKMANQFAFVAGMVAEDGGKQIVAGNERVLRARLSDAKFFWDQDRKRTLKSRIDDLKTILFHAQLGSVYDRAQRVAFASMPISDELGIEDWRKLVDAAYLAKADLTTGVVGEFPELQGVMGRYYAKNDGVDDEMADSIRDHYKPLGAGGDLPKSLLAQVLAISDKIDSLTALWWAGEKPTGSKDPYALRRAALGIVRMVLENKLRIQLTLPIIAVLAANAPRYRKFQAEKAIQQISGLTITDDLKAEFSSKIVQRSKIPKTNSLDDLLGDRDDAVVSEVLDFIIDRLKVALREKGTRHDLIDAVFSSGFEDDLVRLVARVEALQAFLKSDDGANLLAGYKRAANILKAEEKKDGQGYFGEVEESHLSEPAEKALFAALTAAKGEIAPALEKEDFAGAMRTMAGLRAPVDAFFDKVKVNADDKVVRANRLNLLGALRATLHQVADFSKIEG